MRTLPVICCTQSLSCNASFFVSIVFVEFFDEPCKFDYLLVQDKEHNNDILGKFCGKNIPSPVFSKSNSLWVTMITDGQDNRAGFRASWEIQEQEPEGKTK